MDRSTNIKMKIGFIGLGNVGGKLEGSLHRNKYNLTVYDLDKNYDAVKNMWLGFED